MGIDGKARTARVDATRVAVANDGAAHHEHVSLTFSKTRHAPPIAYAITTLLCVSFVVTLRLRVFFASCGEHADAPVDNLDHLRLRAVDAARDPDVRAPQPAVASAGHAALLRRVSHDHSFRADRVQSLAETAARGRLPFVEPFVAI